MNEIKCPKCGTVFQINESDYENVVRQIRDKEFEREICLRTAQYEKEKESAVKLAEAKLEKNHQEILAQKNQEITLLNSELETKIEQTQNKIEKEYAELLNQKLAEISELKTELKQKENENKLKLQEELAKKDQAIALLNNELQTKTEQTQNKLEKEYSEKLNQKIIEITELKNKLNQTETENELKMQEALQKKEQTIFSLNHQLEINKNEYFEKEQNLKENYEEKLKDKEEQIAYYKDFKARQSTKMVGESLEVHCNNEFNKLRPLFGNAYFEKDNDAKSGSKGDFIFRDFDNEGIEIVSIMFEMKNEMDKTATKHRNEDFLKELDKDRKEKKCEYAVLVSLLEMDNDYYNEGIVDVSHKYEKMYVIRPQFFIPLITLIRGMALNTIQYKKQLQIVQNQNIDIANFEENMNTFKEAFGRNYRLASSKFEEAIKEIDNTITHLEKTKAALLSSENNLRLANNKAEDLNLKKLAKNSPSIAALLEEKEASKPKRKKMSVGE